MYILSIMPNENDVPIGHESSLHLEQQKICLQR
jgi:hypothetical protein